MRGGMREGVVLVQLGAASKLKRARLLEEVSADASRAMWGGSSCTDRETLRRHCFSAQSCGQTGAVLPLSLPLDDLTIALVDGDAFVGILMARDEGKGTLFIYNVCVEHGRRRNGHAGQLFAWLDRVLHERDSRPRALELTVYAPGPSHLRGGKEVRKEVRREVSYRLGRLLRMYARMGFGVTDRVGDMIHMHSDRLKGLDVPRGTVVVN